MRDKKLRQEILALENEVKELEKTLGAIKQRLLNLKDLAWDKQSKKESSSMYKVLKEDKTHTMVKSELGDIKVDKDFMEKEITKHLDNPNLRGMVTTKEMLSFPKVAKGVEADKETRGYTWRVKANDGNILVYGSRKYEFDNEKIHRLATTHSQTERNERKAEEDRRGHPYHPVFNDLNFRKSANEKIISQNQIKENEREVEKAGVGERGHSHRQINDPDFLRPADEIISQKIDETIKKQKAFIEQMLQKQESISSIPRVEEFLKEETKQETMKHTPKQRIKK
ncbi:hypothetical protein ACV20C_001550 [Campylobacter upsaliensis]|uniref:hypothetical protein n=1 Tax=Campylobacter upsaliensis TaxID=28080 RepID=UPI00126B0A61|nr:hypothetical protein [Campylobacter upsaliensis]EAJ3972036.1 hypothetical protein [Campylobacter upsaliensis]EAJ7019017.1 hypothetical protein [Campylobacter upsaliensis]EAK1592143.1 hypothetical protein [Campylobacter upsaliensis]EAK2739082.1 hypothetical protein [Campylobacter upsaliensis]EAK4236051.1 hypothetical protein [Campylobacter upsaliensis]